MPENHHTTDENPNQWPRQMPFSVPPEFFNSHRNKIMQEIRQAGGLNKPVQVIAELERISPLLAKTKLEGITGKWDHRTPEKTTPPNSDNLPIPDTEAPIIIMGEKGNRETRWWLAAAVTIGFMAMLGFLWNQQEFPEPFAAAEEEYDIHTTDSIGFSDEEMTIFLDESGHASAPVSAHKINETYSELNVNSTEMLIEPVLFDQQMEHIPVSDLEAFLQDLSPFTD
jgi:hypothetical protein